MSLEQDIAQLTAETNGLLNEIRGQKNSIDSATEQLKSEAANQLAAMQRHVQAVSYGVISGEGSVLTVGPKGHFKNLQLAWNHLANKVLRRRVTIQLEDGVHVYDGNYSLWHQPFAHLIRIQGNNANPERCVLKFVHGKRAYPDSRVLINIGNAPGLVMSGFTVEGEFRTSTGDWYHHGIRVHRGDLHLVSNTVRLRNLMIGLEAYYNGEVHAHHLKMDKVGRALTSASGSFVYANHLVHQGLGRTTQIKYSDGQTKNWGYTAIHATANSHLYAAYTNLKDVPYGFNASNNSYIWCPGSSVTNAYMGFLSHWGSQLWTSAYGTQKPVATNCDYGYRCGGKAWMLARHATAQNCKFGYSVETNSFMDAHSSRALNCTYGFYAHTMSLIEAWGTVKASTGNKTPYSPVEHGQLTNDHARIRRS